MTFRKIIFWSHLIAGLVAGIVIAIMSITGIAIAFEEEILAWVDSELSYVEPASDGQQPLSPTELKAALASAMPELAANRLVVQSDPSAAYEFYVGREGPVYINPYTAEVKVSQAHATHEMLHVLEDWHRWLGMSGDGRTIGRLITGVCNTAFLYLCVSGLYLWFPRRWTWRALKHRVLFKRGCKGKARDYNWHNVIGIWTLPVLTVLVATGVVISFGWAHNLVFLVAGEEPPVHRDFRMTLVPPVEVTVPENNSERASIEAVLATVQQEFPGWQRIGLNFDQFKADENAKAAPLSVEVTMPDYMPNRAYIPVEVDPYSGKVLRAIRLEDRSIGLQSRIWIRFLHTGGAFGVTGKIIASIATLGSLFLVYTGFALSYRRFAPRKAGTAARRAVAAQAVRP